MNDDDLIAGFEAGTLPGFPHEDHVRLVFVQLRDHDPATALAHVSAGIRAMAIRNSNPGAYHDTRTVAWFRLIADAAGRSDCATSAEFLAQHPQFARRDLLDDYYSADLLNSPDARFSFTEPDRQPLPA